MRSREGASGCGPLVFELPMTVRQKKGRREIGQEGCFASSRRSSNVRENSRLLFLALPLAAHKIFLHL